DPLLRRSFQKMGLPCRLLSSLALRKSALRRKYSTASIHDQNGKAWDFDPTCILPLGHPWFGRKNTCYNTEAEEDEKLILLLEQSLSFVERIFLGGRTIALCLMSLIPLNTQLRLPW